MRSSRVSGPWMRLRTPAVEPFRGRVGGHDAEGFLELLEPAAVAPKGGVLVAKGLVLAEEAAILLLEAVDIARHR